MLKEINFILTGPEKRKLIGLAFGSLILALSETLSIGLIIPIMNLFMSPEKINGSPVLQFFCNITGVQDKTVFLSALIVFTMVVFFFKSVYAIAILYSQYDYVGKVYTRLTTKVLSSYLFKPYSFHLKNNSSVLFKNTTTEVGQFTAGFLTPAISICGEVLVFLGVVVLLLWVYPVMTFSLVVIFLAVMVFLNFFLKHRIKSYAIQREKCGAKIYVGAVEAFGGIKEIQVNNVQSFFTERFLQANSKYQESFVKFNVVSSLPRYIMETILFTVMLVVILFSLNTNKALSDVIPMLVVIGAASLKLLPSLNKIYSNFNSYQYCSNSLDIVYSILKDVDTGESAINTPTKKSAAYATPSETAASALRFENVKFSYALDLDPIFEGLTLDIPLNKTTAFVGMSGAGKSTLIDIITGLLKPTEGMFYHRTGPVNDTNVIEYRKKIGYVPQQIFLVDDTIEANIAFGLPKETINRDRMNEAVKIAQIGQFIDTLEDGLATQVGERGVRLSGGQRQRIGLARALYRQPEILILDEATSALDGHTESAVIGAMRELGEAGMTIILVAHRLSTISHADIVYVMDHGRVVDSGAPAVLLKQSDIFNKILHQKELSGE